MSILFFGSRTLETFLCLGFMEGDETVIKKEGIVIGGREGNV